MLDDADNGQVATHLADGQGDVGVRRVLTVGEEQASLLRLQPGVGRLAVQITSDDGSPFVQEPGGFFGIRLDDVAWNPSEPKLFADPGRNLIVAADDDVIPDVQRAPAEGARSRTWASSQGA